ncbi:MAG: ISL3 family transposase [Desulfobacteraceae bacterium]|nr:MAG: ISL3 family transposase [Desulfobacteraceae bacterium]
MVPLYNLPTNVQLKAHTMSFNNGHLYYNVSASQRGSKCPLCGKTSFRVHSKYERMLADLPVSGHQTRFNLIARRYFCDNSKCRRKIFTEQFQFEIKPYRRRLLRSNKLLGHLALELGGNTGSRISRHVGIPVSPSTLLRIIKQIEIQTVSVTSGIIGIDDWAFKKGNKYGTVVIDLETRKVIDLLPNREADTLSNWLKDHPEIKVISRDRAGPYALGARNGAPQAIQVADRFHLLMNLGEATKKVFQSKGKELKEAFKIFNDPLRSESRSIDMEKTSDYFLPENKPVPTTTNIKRLYLFDKVKELHQKGRSIKSISKILKIHRQTVKKYIKAEEYPKYEGKRTSNFDMFRDYLSQENNRIKTRRELYQIVIQFGFNGKYSSFTENLNKLWEGTFPTKNKAIAVPKPIVTWSTSKLSMMLYMNADRMNSYDNEFLNLLFENYPEIKHMAQLVKSFKDLFKNKEDGKLKIWIDDAMNSKSGLKNFAANLLKDFQAINNAVVTTYSNGQVEGQVNRIKNIKRKMYGRAGFQMLRKMVLLKSG